MIEIRREKFRELSDALIVLKDAGKDLLPFQALEVTYHCRHFADFKKMTRWQGVFRNWCAHSSPGGWWPPYHQISLVTLFRALGMPCTQMPSLHFLPSQIQHLYVLEQVSHLYPKTNWRRKEKSVYLLVNSRSHFSNILLCSSLSKRSDDQ